MDNSAGSHRAFHPSFRRDAGAARRSGRTRHIVNYLRAAIAAGASFVGFLVMAGTLLICVATTIDLSIFAGGPQFGGQLLWFLLLPTAVSLSSALITNVLGGGRKRSAVSAASAFFVAFFLVYADLSSNTTPPGIAELLIAMALLLASSLSVLIATVHRTDIGYPRIVAMLVLTVALAGGAGMTIAAVSIGSGDARILIAIAAWFFLPTLVALFIPPVPSATQTPKDSAS